MRPTLDQWEGDAAITLAEAVELFFPDGPLNIKSFRTAALNGELAFRIVAGKYFTTPDAVREMLKPELRNPPAKVVMSRQPAQQPLNEAEKRAAALASQQRAMETIRELKENMRERDRQAREKAKAERDKRR